MSEKFKLKGICVCGHDPEEDPNEDCERCWLVTRILDLTHEAVEDNASMLRAELARTREERDGLRRAADDAVGFLSFGLCKDAEKTLRTALAPKGATP